MNSYISLPETSKVWIFQSNRELSEAEAIEIRNRSDVFIQQWASHGVILRAAMEIFYNRFVVLCVDEERVQRERKFKNLQSLVTYLNFV